MKNISEIFFKFCNDAIANIFEIEHILNIHTRKYKEFYGKLLEKRSYLGIKLLIRLGEITTV